MLLVADIGNTNVHLGLYSGEALLAAGKFSAEDVAEMDARWERFLDGRKVEKLDGAAVCSVNPKIKIPFTHWIAKRFGARPRVVGETLRLDMALEVDDPAEVGADRVVNAYAAWREYRRGPIVIVDAGTAITFDVVSEGGAYRGGAIAPGFQTAARALSSLTALLPTVRVGPVERAIGHNTVDALKGGLFFGLLGLVDALCEKVASELPAPPIWLATGGDGEMIASRSRVVRIARPNLTLDGLRLGWEAHVAAGGEGWVGGPARAAG
jgi:type III pantothenate kinase